MLARVIVNGITLGLLYALIAIGYSIVFSILELINFAHGPVYMVGAVIAVTLFGVYELNFGLSFIVATLGAAALGMLVEKCAVFPLRQINAPKVGSLISTIGMATAIETLVLILYGPQTRPLTPPFDLPSIEIGELSISGLELLIGAAALVSLYTLQAFLNRTKPGTAIRATAQNALAARAMGIDVNKVISITFAIGSALGAISGIMFGMYFNSVYPTMGSLAGLKGFSAAVIGGIGSLEGAVVGGLILGIAENLGSAYSFSAVRDIVAFSALVLVLLVKPQGLLGRSVDKV